MRYWNGHERMKSQTLPFTNFKTLPYFMRNSQLITGWTIWGSNHGEGKIFCTCPDLPQISEDLRILWILQYLPPVICLLSFCLSLFFSTLFLVWVHTFSLQSSFQIFWVHLLLLQSLFKFLTHRSECVSTSAHLFHTTYSSSLMMETAASSEMLRDYHQAIQNHVPEDSHLHSDCHNPKFHKFFVLSRDIIFITPNLQPTLGGRNSCLFRFLSIQQKLRV